MGILNSIPLIVPLELVPSLCAIAMWFGHYMAKKAVKKDPNAFPLPWTILYLFGTVMILAIMTQCPFLYMGLGLAAVAVIFVVSIHEDVRKYNQDLLKKECTCGCKTE